MTFASAGLQFHYPQGIVGKAAKLDGRCLSGSHLSEEDAKYIKYSSKSTIVPSTAPIANSHLLFKQTIFKKFQKGYVSYKQMAFGCKRGLNIAQSGYV